ncbi:hypothetical protein SAMN05444344_1810 [Tenacibaculum mesophilum]|nr:hypothetical protein SAMN05444344_1810 [Tenacibaculum mesophilum]
MVLTNTNRSISLAYRKGADYGTKKDKDVYCGAKYLMRS